jgi:hypothetical protein
VYYIPYLILKNQLKDHCKAKLIIEGVEVYFEKGASQDQWLIRANIEYAYEGKNSSLQEIIRSLDKLAIENGYLRTYPEEGVVILVQEIEPLNHFTSFKEAIEKYMVIYDFWKSIVEDMMKSKGLFPEIIC